MNVQNKNGQDRVGTGPDDGLRAFDSFFTSVADVDQGPHFCANPAEYDWRCTGQKEILVPYKLSPEPVHARQDIRATQQLDPRHVRWERRQAWIVHGDLRPGESNLLQRRNFYLDVNSWAVLLGEGFDASGCLVQYYMLSRSPLLGPTKHGRWYKI